MPKDSHDIVESYVVYGKGIVKGSDSGLRSALGSGYRVINIITTSVGGDDGFAVVTALLTKGNVLSRFRASGTEVGNG